MTTYQKRTLLIDINAWGYAGQQATKLKSGQLETQACFSVLKTLRNVRQNYLPFSPIVLWDGRAQWRYNLYPGYKSNRESSPDKVAMKEAYKKMRPFIERALTALGVPQLMAVTHEADDVAGWLVEMLSKDPEHLIGLMSGDQDWIQMVRHNVFWRDIRELTRKVDARTFYEYTGCRTPLEFIERKCLTGDTSDTITPAGGFGPEGAPAFIAQWGSVQKFWKACDDGTYKPANKAEYRLWKGECEHGRKQWAALYTGDPDDKKAIQKHKDAWPGQGRLLFRRNFQLMQLLKVAPPRKEDIRSTPGKFDKDAFADVCAELSFLSILKNVDEFVAPFLGKTS